MSPDNFVHLSVLKDETIGYLNVKPGGIYLDMTLGAGGHSAEILRRGGILYAFDRDGSAIEAARKRLSLCRSDFTLFWDDYNNFDKYEIPPPDGVLFDLGVSSPQIDDRERGFSYTTDAALDMRMDSRQELDAGYVVNNYTAAELTRIFRQYGEERYAKRIANLICAKRVQHPVRSTGELAAMIEGAVPYSPGSPAKRVFQALRIEVNNELEPLKDTISKSIQRLLPNGRIVVISFHSLEDRIVKTVFAEKSNPCVCPPGLPVCACGRTPELEILTRKPVTAGTDELNENKRAHSAKLRAAMKI